MSDASGVQIVPELGDMIGAVRYPVHDPVHDRVWLTPWELAIVDTQTFQRLRRVSQLGLAEFVFPGATRSRFSHSIGALHVMGELLKANKATLTSHLKAYNIDWRALRLAALLHDIGHLPFSHPTELVYERLEYEKSAALAMEKADLPRDLLYRASEPSGVDASAAPDGQTNGEDDTPTGGYAASVASPSHEALAQHVLLHDDEIRSILESVSHEMPSLVGQLIRGLPTFSAVATALVSSDLDADRLDFVIRDSDSAGVIYGHVDLAYLMENVTVAYASGVPVFAIDAKHGSGALEHYLLARSFIYSQVVHHKTVAAAEVLLRAILLGAADAGLLPPSAAGIEEWFAKRQFHRLTDGYVWSLLGEAATTGVVPDTGSAVPEELRDLIWRLFERRLPKVAWSEVILGEPEETRPRRRLKRAFRSQEGKQQIANKASSYDAGVRVEPRDICLLERRVKIVEKYVPPEAVGQNVQPPKGVLVADSSQSPAQAYPLQDDKSSFIRPMAGLQRMYRYVFVLEDERDPIAAKQKPKARAVGRALADLGLLEVD